MECDNYHKCINNASPYLYSSFRIIIGVLFFLHGAKKLFGLGGDPIGAINLFWFAGLFEVIAGLFLVFGFFSRIGGVLGAATMLVAYFMVHIKNGLHPFTNGGELALVFFATFLVIIAQGNGIWSLEKAIWKKEHC
ncbi:DoxX family protein [Candidatus Woesearchaeota archaeon]|jgi:putative oxidoreductase|nr:DoxX family protein [Candidatus Woesearchaeota archaeon]